MAASFPKVLNLMYKRFQNKILCDLLNYKEPLQDSLVQCHVLSFYLFQIKNKMLYYNQAIKPILCIDSLKCAAFAQM